MLGSGARLVPGYTMRGDTIAGRYRVDRLLGVGGSGFVVAARHARLDQHVALKVLTTLTTAQGKAILATAHRVASLSSPHVAKVIDTGLTEEGYPFVATVMSEGRSLARMLEERGTLPAREAVALVRQACAGLADAHAAGIVHGDLKPQNLLLTKTGRLELLDFGMTQPLESEEGSAAWFASPAYLAPEQLRDPAVDARADIWALGVILHQLVAGKLPFDAETIAGMFVAVAYHEPALLAAPDVPYELAKVVHACLSKHPAGRPQTARGLADQLAPFASAESASPQLAMAVSLEPEDLLEDVAEVTPIESNDLLPVDPPALMAVALKRGKARPPPLPKHRLGAAPRPAKATLPSLDVVRARVAKAPRFARGWLAARLEERRRRQHARSEADRTFQRRRWGAVAVVVAAGVLLVLGLVSPSPSSAAAAAELVLEPAESLVFERPLAFGLRAFVPPTFALPEREETVPVPPPGPFMAAVLPPPPPPPGNLSRSAPPVRPRLAVREDPYFAPAARVNVTGFTHPTRLPDRSPTRGSRGR